MKSGRVRWCPLDLLILFESDGVRRSPPESDRSPSESDRTSPIGLQESPTGLILMKFSIFDESDRVRSGPVGVWSDFFRYSNGNPRFQRSPIGPGQTRIGLVEVRLGLQKKALSPRIVKISPRIVSDVRRTPTDSTGRPIGSDRVRSESGRTPEVRSDS